MLIFKHIPNLLTSCNLLCGCIGIILASRGELTSATYLIWIAMVFDFLDGFVARILNVSSPIGKELDSLADMVTFGVLPSIIMYELISASGSNNSFIPFIAFLIAVFSALRLAKFNIDDRQSDVFIGLPTPANALFISSLIFFSSSHFAYLISQGSLIGITIIFSLLLVAPLKLFSLKIKTFKIQNNIIRLIFLLISVSLILIFKLLALPLVIILYILMSILNQVFRQTDNISS